MKYREFIATKQRRPQSYGFEPITMNAALFDWQTKIVDFAIRRGRAAIFADTGLGKTPMELCWTENVVRHSGPVLLLCPLGVRRQTVNEAAKFGIGVECKLVNDQSECINGINITNYDKLQHFDADWFAGVVLGESSILKSMSGKTRTMLINLFEQHRFRLAETATPAPNDHMELGNHAEFLSVMQSVDMLNRYFYHDSSNTSNWVLMPHGRDAFWEWVASWAVCIGMPSDIGGDDTPFILPPLNVHRHYVEISHPAVPAGYLFSPHRVSATSLFEEKRITADDRIAKALELIPTDRPAVVWCDTNYESERLSSQLNGQSAEIRGSDRLEDKEERLAAFANGEIRTLISKPSICGHGLNWQHCSTQIFSGLTYSFELYYQAVRRCWRFGQTKPVDVHIVLAETDTALQSTISRKDSDFQVMRASMAEAMRSTMLREFGGDKHKEQYEPRQKGKLPSWLKPQK